MYCLEKFFPQWRDLAIHESSPILGRGPSRRLVAEAPGYLPSYYLAEVPAGESVNGVRCENLENLSFDDKSIDLHVTQDVFEHLFDPAAAFREIARTLRPGGAHVFTTPLENKGAATEFCARRMPDGQVLQLIEPAEYHGNPVSSAGSLLTVRWGYDITQYIFDATGLTTELVVLDNLELGIRAELIEVLITRNSGG
ncbi:MAG TPA: class I SAM-dependent methyltransferase [Chthoniobacterales bacterium]|nr:class I SAM-dependent methyltransferase [Chthoniobacterales bacterium]